MAENSLQNQKNGVENLLKIYNKSGNDDKKAIIKVLKLNYNFQNELNEVENLLKIDYKSGNDNIEVVIKVLKLNYVFDSVIRFFKSYDCIEEKDRKVGIDNIEVIRKALLEAMRLSSFEEFYKKFSLIVNLTSEDNVFYANGAFVEDNVFYANGAFVNVEDFSLQEFITNHVSDTTTLFLKMPDLDINKDSFFSFRKWVIENKFLHGVVQLPTADETGQLLIIRKQSIDKIFYVDAMFGYVTDKKVDYGKLISTIEEKDSKHYLELSIDAFLSHNSQYIIGKRQFAQELAPTPKEGEILVPLKELVDLYESEVQKDVHCYFLNRPYYYSNDFHEPLEAVMMPMARKVPDEKFFLFKWDDDCNEFLCAYQTEIDTLDLNHDFSTGIEVNYEPDEKPIICTYPNSIIFKLKEKPAVPIDPYYLKRLFYSSESSEEVIAQMNYYKLPYWDFSMNNEDFLSIVVAIPSMEEQQRILNLDRPKVLADTREEIKKNLESYKQDIRMKKHALAQRLTIMNNWWKTLLMARKDGNGIIDDEAVVGRLHPVAVKNIYAQIGHEMNMLFKQLNSFNLGDAMDNKEIFDATAFVQEYVIHHDPMFEYQCELPDKPANIRFPKEAFQIILDNISSNACFHGFKGREKEKNIIRIRMEIKGYDLIVQVSNNGKPMPVKMTAEKVFTYGDTTEEGIDEHGGLGGYQIKDLMERFGGEVELLLDAEADFPVAYKLVFRDVNIYK